MAFPYFLVIMIVVLWSLLVAFAFLAAKVGERPGWSAFLCVSLAIGTCGAFGWITDEVRGAEAEAAQSHAQADALKVHAQALKDVVTRTIHMSSRRTCDEDCRLYIQGVIMALPPDFDWGTIENACTSQAGADLGFALQPLVKVGALKYGQSRARDAVMRCME